MASSTFDDKLEIRKDYYLTSALRMFNSQVNDIYSDVSIIVEGTSFKCHRLILSGASEYFDEMFRPDASVKEFTLPDTKDTKLDVFRNVLEFIYSGEPDVIDHSNMFSLIRAAETFKLPSLEKFCRWFMEHDKKNMNAIAEDVLKIVKWAHEKQKKDLLELLRAHIVKNFAYFTKSADFTALPFKCLVYILDSIQKSIPPALHDAFSDGCFVWIRNQIKLSDDTRIQYSRELLKKIDFARLSPHHTQSNIKRSMKVLVMPPGKAKGIIATPNRRGRFEPKLCHAYILSGSQTPSKIRVFTQHTDKNFHGAGPADGIISRPTTWSFTGELALDADFIRSIVLEGSIYLLSYSEKHESQQLFCKGSSVLMYPYTPLKRPPATLKNFDLCGSGNEIFVYSKTEPTIWEGVVANADFTDAEIIRGMYVYERDEDKWLPLPAPTVRYMNACMTCDEDFVYLIGGSNSNKAAQVYSRREGKWLSMSGTAGTYDGADCCACANRIFVCSGQADSPDSFEMFSPKSRTWQSVEWFTGVMSRNLQLRTLKDSPGQFLSFSTKWEENQVIHRYTFPKDDTARGVWDVLDDIPYNLMHCVEKIVDENTMNVPPDEYTILEMVYF